MKDEAEKQDWGWQSGAFVEFGGSKGGLLPSELCCRNVETPWLLLSKPLQGGAEYPSVVDIPVDAGQSRGEDTKGGQGHTELAGHGQHVYSSWR